MSDFICHDFKTPRNDTSKRLPDTFKAIPVLFYLSIVGAVYFMTMDWMSYKQAEKDKKVSEERKAELDEATKQLQTEKTDLDAETAKAESLAKWVEAARNVQPISVAVARAMPPEVRLSDLTIERSDQVPANLSFGIKINGGSASEIALLESSLSRLQYRSLSAQSSKVGEVIEYRSTLVRQEQ